MKFAFREYTWRNVAGRDGLLLKDSQIVGFSKLDDDYREFLLQGKRSMYRVLVKGSQPIDHAIDRNVILKLSPPTDQMNPLRKWLLNPKLRTKLSGFSILGTTTVFMGNFVYRAWEPSSEPLVSFPLVAAALLVGPSIGVVSAALHRHRDKGRSV
jgi:hypothetical protein